MPRYPRKFKSEGLRKTCKHLSADKCECPWIARIPGHRYVNVSKWAGLPDNITRTQAADERGEMLALLRQGKFDPKSKFESMQGETVSFEDALDIYEADNIAAEWKGRSSRKSYYTAWKAEFGKRGLQTMAQDSIAAEVDIWLKKRWPGVAGKDRKAITRARYREYANTFFNWAGAGERPEKNWVTTNPMRLVDMKNTGKSKFTGKRMLEDVEEKLIAAAQASPDPKMQMVGHCIEAGLDTGLRSGELRRVRVRDIDFTTGRVMLHDTKGQKLSTNTGEDEVVFIGTDRVRQFVESRRFLGLDAHVWGNSRGLHLGDTAMLKRVRKLCKLAGVPYGRYSGTTFHVTRHEFCSRTLEDGCSHQEAMEAARHRDITTTLRYSKAREERLKALFEKRQRA
jgi:integrase